ncbi:MAG: PQQ-dependent sugar dehydrogenase [Gammaproteobacteria bacterium]|nr:PQQ-dependent sugar dehydrogenase [Gammaproteobacteria bacterium]MCW8928375.1 PQQ-dependent sugar dehydrogenase [Gammaproteobacteria bacterium]MCW8959679.1 PQQ-dependent sugar dehydrogenase [Gammaproteobacteria bacterium]MCW8973210.1 PQQ-dependent sugar dehydrogenase [Gammaproteobacteria bacterium]MCW8993955.1 PQQ-dependent sugar dehydrogenase [Gammaproteobacteria bacterium]
MKRSRLFCLPLLLLVSLAVSAGQASAFKLERVAVGLGVPWAMVFVDADTLLFTERGGRLGRLELGSGEVEYLAGVPEVFAEGQGGLLDVVLAPDFSRSAKLYFTYSKSVGGKGATTLASARLEGSRLLDWQDLIVTRSRSNTTRHFGSRIAFDDKGHVYFGIGDRGVRDNGQDLRTHAGSVLRLHLDGSVPQDNPFVGHDDVLPEIWSYGHRNPQGLVYDRGTQRLWLIEHGPRGGDEINLVLPGRNYGWPVVSHGKEYWGPVAVGEATSKPGMEDPLKVYIPSIAPGSLLRYSGKAFPEWQGDLFAGALVLRHLNRVVLNGDGKVVGEERLLEDLNERIRALSESPEGWLYLSTDSGKIYRLRPG